MPAIFFNGQLTDADAKLFPINAPGVKFGEGIFETMLVKDGRIFLEELHWERLITGFEKIALYHPFNFSITSWRNSILSLAHANQHSVSKVRTTFLRNTGGQTDYIIESADWEIKSEFEEKGLHCGIFTAALKTADEFANLKHNNFLPYRMAQLAAKKKGWDEALILNNKGNICEACIYNIFIFKRGEIITPPLSEGCVAGTLRQFIVNNFMVKQQEICITDLMSADEIMLTNSVQLLRRVEKISDRHFGYKEVSRLYKDLKQKMLWLFED